MDEHQFKERVIPLNNRIYGICLSILGNPHEAKDCVQDVYVKLWANRGILSEIRSLEAYITTVAKNQCFDRIRLRKDTVAIDKVAARADQSTEHIDQEYSDPRLERLNIALNQLPELQRQVFNLRDIEHMEFEEIGTKMGISPENVRVTLSRARKRIREIIEEDIIRKRQLYE